MKNDFLPYLDFPRKSWSKFRKDTPMTLNAQDLKKLRGQIEVISAKEVREVYLPLARLLSMYFAAQKQLYDVTESFLGHLKPKVPYIIGIAGSVAVGKSTTSRVLKALLERWPEHRWVDIVTTDGFLYPNAYLDQHQLMERKGFPESYDLRRLIRFLSDVKSGKPKLKVPLYSHQTYDILTDKFQIVDQPDILILEGLNVLQVGNGKTPSKGKVFVSDFFDFSIYVDAESETIMEWFLKRFTLFRHKARSNPRDFFYQFAKLKKQKALEFAKHVWMSINELNLVENILPYKQRADLILVKNEKHLVTKVLLKKL